MDDAMAQLVQVASIVNVVASYNPKPLAIEERRCSRMMLSAINAIENLTGIDRADVGGKKYVTWPDRMAAMIDPSIGEGGAS